MYLKQNTKPNSFHFVVYEMPEPHTKPSHDSAHSAICNQCRFVYLTRYYVVAFIFHLVTLHIVFGSVR